MKYLLLLPLVAVTSLHASTYTNSVSVDAFVRASATTSNYGGAGALSVSGSTATNASGVANGVFDTFIRFNTAGMVSNFNSTFGTNNWVVNGAILSVTEVGAPTQTIFNRGKGAFEIRWIANDTWTEGTGMPNTPTTTGIVYNNEATLLNVANDFTLGSFTNSGIDGLITFPFQLPVAFVSDLSSGGEVGLYLKAIDSGTGFTFNSRSFGTTSARPFLVVSAIPRPFIKSISVSGTDVLLSCSNGIAAGTYQTLSTTNPALPINQWQPVATNTLSVGGSFIITLTNATVLNSAKQQFFLIQTR